MRVKFNTARQNTVFKFAIASLLPRSTAILAAFVLTPLIIGRLGFTNFGVWTLATLIPTLLASYDFGITYGLINEMSKTYQRDRHFRNEKIRLGDTQRLLLMISSLWFIVGSSSIFLYVFGGGGKSEDDPGKLFISLLIALCIFVLGIPSSLWQRVQLASERGHEYVAWEGAGKVLSFLLSLLVLFTFPNLYALIIVTLLPNVVASYINAKFFVKRNFGQVGFKVKGSLRDVIERNHSLFNSGKYFVVFQIAYLISTAIDPYMINQFLGTNDVSYLSLARRPFDVLPLIVTLYSTALWPVFNRLNAGGKVGELVKLMRRIAWISSAILIAVCFALIIFSEPLYNLLSHGKAHILPVDLFWISIRTIALTLATIFNNYLNAIDYLRQQAWVQTVAAGVTVVAKIDENFSDKLKLWVANENRVNVDFGNETEKIVADMVSQYAR